MIFEVGEEYWMVYGTADEQMHDCIKVVEVDGTWLKVEAEKLEPLINIAAPFYVSARKRDRAAEQSINDLRAQMQPMNDDELRAIAGKSID